MSRRTPITDGRPRPDNVAVLLREVFVALNDRAVARLAERGHAAVRPAHSAVFQYLDDTGTTVSTLAERAQVTKQAMAELVAHLETHGYVVRQPDPADRRAKLVLPTTRGREVVAIAQKLVPEIDALIAAWLGPRRAKALRVDLDTLRARLTGPNETAGIGVEDELVRPVREMPSSLTAAQRAAPGGQSKRPST